MVDWKKIREDFPVCKDKTYFMSAALSPLPRSAVEAAHREYATLSECGDVEWEGDIRRMRELCGDLGKHIGCKADDIAFLQNTSTAMSVLALSLKNELGADFNVVSMLDEFPSSTVPFEYAGIKMRYVEPVGARYSVETVLEKVDAKTAAVVTSYVQYSTGFRQNLWTLGEELKKRGVMLIVNATQAFPLFPVDVVGMNVSAMSASVHKWGFCGQVGAMFFTSPEFRKRFKPPFAGWLSLRSDDGLIHTSKNAPLKLSESAERYSCGCINLQAINTFGAAFKYLSGIGFDNIRARIFQLTEELVSKLQGLGISVITPFEKRDERSGIVTFNVGERGAECVEFLQTLDIYCSFRAGNVRAAVNFFNDTSDIEKLVAALVEFLEV